ncbi:protein FAM53A [Echinops telfairi]|uniref:Protein FAM53A n=1 Tax=Echinops telfairi TaxID=9371 RepID=A0AC55D0Z6_ECHTE|nr:protein FAM53A [Echinops telfairi]
MVTLITEKLQNQSLDDLARKTYDASPYSTERVNKSGGLFSFGLNVVKSPWKVVSGGRPARSGEGAQHAGFPFPPPGPFGPAPPMGLQWRPEAPGAAAAAEGGSDSDVSLGEHAGQPLAPPTKRHCRSLSEPDELARCRSPWRPEVEALTGSVGMRFLSQTEAASLSCDPPPPGQCQQPLPLLQTLKNSKSLCSLDYEDDEEDEAHVKTVVSSPRDAHGLTSAVSPAPSPARPRPWTPREHEGPGAASDGDSAGEEEGGVFPLDCGDLDLEQIENN